MRTLIVSVVTFSGLALVQVACAPIGKDGGTKLTRVEGKGLTTGSVRSGDPACDIKALQSEGKKAVDAGTARKLTEQELTELPNVRLVLKQAEQFVEQTHTLGEDKTETIQARFATEAQVTAQGALTDVTFKSICKQFENKATTSARIQITAMPAQILKGIVEYEFGTILELMNSKEQDRVHGSVERVAGTAPNVTPDPQMKFGDCINDKEIYLLEDKTIEIMTCDTEKTQESTTRLKTRAVYTQVSTLPAPPTDAAQGGTALAASVN